LRSWVIGLAGILLAAAATGYFLWVFVFQLKG
jgi:hypothetical protein